MSESALARVNQIVASALEQANLPSHSPMVTWSGRPDLGDMQCNAAMALAKLIGMAPLATAERIREVLSGREEFTAVTVAAPGFVNVKLAEGFLADFCSLQLQNPLHGTVQRTGHVFVDFGGPNVAKPLHVGHLRSLVIGESLRRLHEALGYRVTSDVHFGDWGLQMGMLISEIHRRYPEVADFNSVQPRDELRLSPDDLLTLYPEAAAACREHPELMDEARLATAKLQMGNPEFVRLWRQLREISLQSVKSEFGRLEAHFDLLMGESDVQPLIPDLVDRLIADGIATESNGAWVIEVSEPDDKTEVPPMILVKSDGAALYSTTDLATIKQRTRDFAPDKIVYVVDQRQSLHFLQLFRAAKKAGLASNTELIHAGFGTVNGLDGKPYRTRDGGVASLRDLLDSAVTKSTERLQQAGFSGATGELEEIGEAVGLGAVKFADLSSVRTSGYVFDLDRLVSFEGRTGPYIQYACVRINSILAKADRNSSVETSLVVSRNFTLSERDLIIQAAKFPDSLERALSGLAPNEIADYAFELARSFSRFYAESEILTSADDTIRAQRLTLCKLTMALLEKALWLLGIQVPARM
jgi:arginyl-tRNA synthetase